MMQDDEFFDDGPNLARRGDPVTSHLAADQLVESGKWRNQKYRVLAWMSEHRLIDNRSSLTANELARESGLPHPLCHKRLPDLRKEGLVCMAVRRDCRVTGLLAYTWRLTTPEERAAWRGDGNDDETGEGDMAKALTKAEASVLAECEAVIERGLSTFMEVGQALFQIHANHLYRDHYKSFEDYCRLRWTISRQRAYQLIDAVGVVANIGGKTLQDKVVSTQVDTTLQDKVPKGITEKQCRQLAALPAQQQREVASTIDFTTATAAEVRERVEQTVAAMKTEPAEESPLPEPEPPDTSNAVRWERRILAASALKQPITRAQLYECLKSKSAKSNREWDRALVLVPWLRVQEVGREKVRLKVDRELKEVCDQRREDGMLPRDVFRHLYRELMRKQKEADYLDRNRCWKPDAVAKVDLIAIIMWVARELQNHSNGLFVKRLSSAAESSPLGREDDDHDSKVELSNASVDAGAGPVIQ